MRRVNKRISNFFNFTKEIFLEPIILAFALSFMFEHIKNTINSANYATIPSWWDIIVFDVKDLYYIYIVFFIILILWAANKYIHIKQDNKRIKDMDTVIMQLEKLTSIMNKKGERVVGRPSRRGGVGRNKKEGRDKKTS